ncbi:DUF3576 domain-containing protein [Thalassococcus sp. S3]|uniref:DUF3576 domain-containing protein n=1 Tax=Thalassococcus sp. S3 TaxID=2017482 RepID=UPI0010243C9C|nr:DUF3576 domain-containing protein [Thalassococcus sp. S3]QBF33797.1 hypothetical protein CFI11_21655 [Thalassococcus sp. S3]
MQSKTTMLTCAMMCCILLSACGQGRGTALGVVSGGREEIREPAGGSSIWDLFRPSSADQTVNVNKYIWNASLDVLSFLPVQTVDPFTGVIVTGYGTPPGGGRAYRATIHVTDPALEARSLRVALQSRSGPVAPSTTRAVEDAILSRARQMRISDNRF